MASPALNKVQRQLEKHGLLLLADAKLPCVVTVIAGKPVRGSWWAALAGKLIYNTANELEAQQDVQILKLISGKITFVHRRLWPALYAIGAARETWQTGALSKDAKAVLSQLDKNGELFTDALVAVGGFTSKAAGSAAKELEKNLLAICEGFRVEGRHHRHLRSWSQWAKQVGLKGKKVSPRAAKEELSNMLKLLNAEYGASGTLPWPSKRKSGAC